MTASARTSAGIGHHDVEDPHEEQVDAGRSTRRGRRWARPTTAAIEDRHETERQGQLRLRRRPASGRPGRADPCRTGRRSTVRSSFCRRPPRSGCWCMRERPEDGQRRRSKTHPDQADLARPVTHQPPEEDAGSAPRPRHSARGAADRARARPWPPRTSAGPDPRIQEAIRHVDDEVDDARRSRRSGGSRPGSPGCPA